MHGCFVCFFQPIIRQSVSWFSFKNQKNDKMTKMKTFFKNLKYLFPVESATIENATLPYKIALKF